MRIAVIKEALDGTEWLCLCGGGTFREKTVKECPRCGHKRPEETKP